MRRRGPAILLLILLIGVAAVVAIFLLTRPSTPTTDAGTVTTTVAQSPGSINIATPVLATATPAPQNVKVVAVSRNLNQGSVLGPDDLDTILISRTEFDADPNRDTYLSDPNAAIGRILKAPLTARQALRTSDIIEGNFSSYMKQLVAEKRLEPGKKAFAYATNDLSTAAGLVAEGDLVDVVATYIFERKGDQDNVSAVVSGGGSNNGTPGSGQSSVTLQRSVVLELSTKTILQNVRVLRVIRFGPPITPFRVEKPTPTATVPSGDTGGQPATTTGVAVGPGTPTPLPTLPPYEESGRQFGTTQILVLAVTDQEAEVLKFTREVRTTLAVSSLVGVNGAKPSLQPEFSADRTILAQIPVVHFTLRSRPQDTANPQDPAVTIDKTSGVTFRTLVRDYGLPIPEAVFATQIK